MEYIDNTQKNKYGRIKINRLNKIEATGLDFLFRQSGFQFGQKMTINCLYMPI